MRARSARGQLRRCSKARVVVDLPGVPHKVADSQLRKCPNCKSPIEKSSGCNHMNCKKCKHEFCWLCLRPYSHYHYKYYNCCGCPGMQFEEEDEMLIERAKQMLLYLTLPLILALVLACYLASIPVYMLGTLLYKPFEWVANAHYPERDLA